MVIRVKKQLQVRIHPDGKIDAKTLGIKGEKCTEYIKILEKLLNAQVVESAYTEEFMQTQENVTTNLQHTYE